MNAWGQAKAVLELDAEKRTLRAACRSSDQAVRGAAEDRLREINAERRKLRNAYEEEQGIHVGIRLSEVEPEDVSWLWHGRIPLGKVTILEGDPDEGKSTLALDLAARVTTGQRMPFDSTPRIPTGVVVLSAEDGLADTILPRVEAAGGNPDRMVAFRMDELPEIPGGIDTIAKAIARVAASFVIVDPLNAFLADRVETKDDHRIRRALAPLAALAQQTGAAILPIRHLNKSGGLNAKYRGGGSIGITGAARSVMLAAPHPDDPERKLLARVKGNLGPPWPTLAYRLIPEGSAVRVEWLGQTSHTASDLLVDRNGADDSALGEAVSILREILTAGPVPSKQVWRELRAAGIADRTAHRAKAKLSVRACKSGFDGGWVWELPPKAAKNIEDCQDETMAAFGEDWQPSGLGEDEEIIR